MQAIFEALRRRWGRIGNFERKLCRNAFARAPLTANDFQIVRTEHTREGEKARLRPLGIFKMAMAARALHARAEEELAHFGSRLDGFSVCRVSDVADAQLFAVDQIRLGLLVTGHGGVE